LNGKQTTGANAMTTIKFNKYNVTNGTEKARVSYSAFKMTTTGQNCVTLYAKSYEDGNKLGNILSDVYENETEIMSDYFEKGRARIIEGHPLYAEAYARATA
jgi:hypothetical protein